MYILKVKIAQKSGKPHLGQFYSRKMWQPWIRVIIGNGPEYQLKQL